MDKRGYQRWTVPKSGTYRIVARGAQGGDTSPNYDPGKGAVIAGDFQLDRGDVLVILVGQKGENGNCGENGDSSSSGGGTFVAKNPQSPEPLVVAAGAAGSSSHDPGDGTDGGGVTQRSNDTGGNADDSAGGGGGWRTDGGDDGGEAPNIGGHAFLNDGVGGTNGGDEGDCEGGFGGAGGSGEYTTYGGPGGYHGGDGTHLEPRDVNAALSFNTGSNQDNRAAAHTGGHGSVTITLK
jgi:hypothetical protein